MLNELEKIFSSGFIEINSNGETIKLHSNTNIEQGLFLQKIFKLVKPINTLEVGLAYGISALFILEMHKMYNEKMVFTLPLSQMNTGVEQLFTILKKLV
jgi:hypothetical protein